MDFKALNQGKRAALTPEQRIESDSRRAETAIPDGLTVTLPARFTRLDRDGGERVRHDLSTVRLEFQGEGSPRSEGRAYDVIRFHDAVTGYEGAVLDQANLDRLRAKPDDVWRICGGTAGSWDRCEVLNRDVSAALAVDAAQRFAINTRGTIVDAVAVVDGERTPLGVHVAVVDGFKPYAIDEPVRAAVFQVVTPGSSSLDTDLASQQRERLVAPPLAMGPEAVDALARGVATGEPIRLPLSRGGAVVGSLELPVAQLEAALARPVAVTLGRGVVERTHAHPFGPVVAPVAELRESTPASAALARSVRADGTIGFWMRGSEVQPGASGTQADFLRSMGDAVAHPQYDTSTKPWRRTGVTLRGEGGVEAFRASFVTGGNGMRQIYLDGAEVASTLRAMPPERQASVLEALTENASRAAAQAARAARPGPSRDEGRGGR